MEIQELPNKELKIIILKMLRELQNNTQKNITISGKQYKKLKSSAKREKTKKNKQIWN